METSLINRLRDKQLKGILLSPEYKKILQGILLDIQQCAKSAPNEATIESRFDTELAILFDKLFSHLGYTYFPTKEDAIETKRCVSKGRADTSIGALIIEYKHCSVLKNQIKRESALEQAADYVESFNAADIIKTVGFVTDGLIGAFITYSENALRKEKFSKLTIEMLDRLVQYIIGLGQKALTVENLIKDFCIVETCGESYGVRLSKALFSVLINGRSQKTEMLIEEWEELFKLAHDDSSQQQAIINRKNALSAYFGVSPWNARATVSCVVCIADNVYDSC